MRALVLLIVLVTTTAPAAASTSPPAHPYALPPGNPLKVRPNADQPTEVTLAIYLLNISHISEEDETLDVDGFIFLRWTDPRLAFDPAQVGSSTRTTSLPVMSDS